MTGHTLEMYLDAKADLFAECRRAVEAGASDCPVTVYRDGKHTVSLGSLHKGACLTVVETPSVRFAPYTPHYRAPIGPRLTAALEADRMARERTREAAILARKVVARG